MDDKNCQDDTTSDASTTGFTANTPPSDQITVGDPWNGHYYTVPWPGSTYMIIEKGFGRAITLTRNGLCLQDISESQNANNRWLCVEKGGYFAFYNEKSGVYMGHDGNNGMRASATEIQAWELLIPRQHPEGGYQLLLPHWLHTMMILSVIEDGRKLVRTMHGTTLWEFAKL